MRVYEVINQSYIDFLHEGGHFSTKKFTEISRSLTSLTPLIGKSTFKTSLLNGGFDVSVGNPPYGNILQR